MSTSTLNAKGSNTPSGFPPIERLAGNASATSSSALLAAPPLMSGVPMRTLPIRREAGRSRVASSPRSNRIKAISEGYDLTIGIMHEGSDGSSKCIFNGAGAAQGRSRGVGFRPRQHFRSGGSVIRTDGVCRLSSQLARMVMARCRNRKSTAGRPESTWSGHSRSRR